MAGTITRTCVVLLLLNIQLSKTSQVQKVTAETKGSSDGLLVHLINSIVKYETKVLEHQLEKHADKVNDLKNKLERQEEKHEDLKKVVSQLEAKYADVEQKHAQDIKILKGSLSTKQPIIPVVGFHVALTQSQSSPGKVLFDRVLSNYGNGWNSMTHVYKVPTKGLYFLTLTVMNIGSSYTWAGLMRGSTHLQRARADGGHNYNVGTTSTVLMLKAGEYIYAQWGRGTIYSSVNLYTHLAGFLIQKTV